MNLRNKKLKVTTLAWYLITDKTFRCWFQEAIKYGFHHANNFRGEGASDVLLFTTIRGEQFSKCWK